MIIFFLLIIIILMLIGIDLLIHNTKDAKLINSFPGPKLNMLIGNGVDFVRGACVMFYKGRSMANTFRKNYRLWLFNNPSINFIEPNEIEVILSSSRHITKSFLYDFIRPWFNDGLLLSTGSKWQIRRKILTPTFHYDILKQFCTIFVEQSNDLVEKLKHEIEKPETEIQLYIAKATLNNICETAMGTNLDRMKDKATEYIDSILDFGEYLVHRVVRVWLYPQFLFNLSAVGRKQRKSIERMHSFTTNIINERRAGRFDNNFGNPKTSKRRCAMLDLLLAAEENGEIDENGIREEVDTFMFEGHDTTSTATIFGLLMLANNPEIQEIAFSEVNDILGYDENQATIDDLNNMRYLERCIKETLRLYPSVPYISRLLKEDLVLQDCVLPANTICNIHIFDMHRDERLFPNPNKFDPDRFLPENSVNRHPFAYIPFSAGSRNCIGQKFAMLEMKAIISGILFKYKLQPITRPDDLIFTCDLVLRTVNSIKIKFVLRN